MKQINPEDHYGKPLPEDDQLPHERRANAFMDIASEQMAQLYPNISFTVHPLTQAEIHMGTGAEKALREWDSSAMAEFRDEKFDDIFKELTEEEAEMGRRADIESAELTRIATTMLGNSESELATALKSIALLAAEKGGSLEESEVKPNFLTRLSERKPDEGFESFAKALMQNSEFVFR